MPKFRKKPVKIEAVRWDGENVIEVGDFLGPADRGWWRDGDKIRISTLEGTMDASAGEFYPCKPDIFAATYEPVESSPHA